LSCAAVVLVACGGPAEKEAPASEPAASAPPLSVFVVNHPLASFAERIGGDAVAVTFPAPPGEDPAFWSPDPETVAAYQGADLILLNGADYAKWVAQASLPSATLVDTGAAYTDRLIPLEEAVTHAHGPEGEHAHGGLAFTTWLDPTLAVAQARAVAAAFETARPGQAEGFGERLALVEAELGALDARLEAATAALGEAPVVFSHPVYQYLEARYGLNGHSVHWEPDGEPSERQWAELERWLGESPARWMIWEAEPLPSVAARLRDLGVESVVFDPCGSSPEEGDFLSVMRANVERVESAWSTLAGP
jgi:zinc transport system substrate-binding protein